MENGSRPQSRSSLTRTGRHDSKPSASPLGAVGLSMLGGAVGVATIADKGPAMPGSADPSAAERKKLDEELAALAKQDLESAQMKPASPSLANATTPAGDGGNDIKVDEGRIGRRAEAAAAKEAETRKAMEESTKVVGENEDNVDDVLEFELMEQELMFQKMFRKRAEREAKKKLEKEEKKRIEEAKKAQAMEFAFDGDLDSLLKAFDEGIELETCDQHGTTILSEASGGGHADLVSLILAEGADPNSLGRYRRTPLWRAAYAGSAEAVQALLRGGGDPREYDEQGQKPIDVTSNKDAKNFLMSWDTSATDKIKEQKGAFARAKAKSEAKEEKARQKAQEKELADAVYEAERRLKIAKVEVAKQKKMAQSLRAQKVSFVEQGAEDKLPEAEHLLSKAEQEWREAEKLVMDLEWKLKRVLLKQRDWKSSQERALQKKAGKLQGFKIEHVVESAEELEELLESLTMDLELKRELTTKKDMTLQNGDVMIKDYPFAHCRDKKQVKEVEIDEWPISIWFNHGFNTTIPLQALSDTLIKDVGGKRRDDGRWPLVIDPSGKTNTFLTYSGVFQCTAMELMNSVSDAEVCARLRKAFLKNLLYGGSFMVDLGDFDFPIELLEEAFNNFDKGLWAKLTDRSVLYSYLLPRRFMRLVAVAPPKEVVELKKEFHEGNFMDDYLMRFTFGFTTTFREPDLEFAKLFYTIRVKDPNEEEEAN